MISVSLIITVIGIRSSKIELQHTNILILLNYFFFAEETPDFCGKSSINS